MDHSCVARERGIQHKGTCEWTVSIMQVQIEKFKATFKRSVYLPPKNEAKKITRRSRKRTTFLIVTRSADSADLSLSLSCCPPLWGIEHPWNALFHFSFLILRRSVGLLGWGISPSQGYYLYKHRQTSMPWMEFEPTIPAFKRVKSVHALQTARPLWSTSADMNAHWFKENNWIAETVIGAHI
jgi:hypothetical protein